MNAVTEIGPCVLCGRMGRTFTDTNVTLGCTIARFLCRAHEPKPSSLDADIANAAADPRYDLAPDTPVLHLLRLAPDLIEAGAQLVSLFQKIKGPS